MSKVKKILGWGFVFFKRLSWPKRIGVLLILFALFSFVMIEVTGTPTFCGSCHIMKEYHASWEASSHSEVSCLKCHTVPGAGNYMKAKIQGMSQSIDYIVGRVGTQAEGTVADASCLRSGCHYTEKLASKTIDFNGVKFTHKGHISSEVDGIHISCGTCHGHYEGDEHFSVNRDVCFTCHFLTGGDEGKRVVETGCRSCHEVPDKVIKRGMVEVNHLEFASYEASCEDSCHKGQVAKASAVKEDSCLMCHSFLKSRKEKEAVELHEIHSEGEKVECFACHENVEHTSHGGDSLLSMMECANCHSDTHETQRSFYGADKHPQGGDDARVVGPMFVTHVACSDCHVGGEPMGEGAVSSSGKVAKATAEACDNCHKKGTGDQSIRLWQGQTKKLHAKASEKVEKLRVRIGMEADEEKIKKMQGAVTEAQHLLDTVEADGSWGVHNLKYTEALLLKANDIVNSVD
jgi:cytochrome c-type protein NapC